MTLPPALSIPFRVAKRFPVWVAFSLAVMLAITTHVQSSELMRQITPRDYSARESSLRTDFDTASTRYQQAKKAEEKAWSRYNLAKDTLSSARGRLDKVIKAAARGATDEYSLLSAWEALRTATANVVSTRSAWHDKWNSRDRAWQNWWRTYIAYHQLIHDYEAQTDPTAVEDELAKCRSTSCKAIQFRTIVQPELETVNAPAAYAKGVTGMGVRIGIDDSAINIWLPELRDRIAFEGAQLTYPIFDPSREPYRARRCMLTGSLTRGTQCVVASDYLGYSVDPLTIDLVNDTARAIVAYVGRWPKESEHWFIQNLTDDTWYEVPAAASDSHGTSVASIAAGRDFGVAPGATVVPIARYFGDSPRLTEGELISWLAKSVSAGTRAAYDSWLATTVKHNYEQVDIINRSYGIHADANTRRLLESDTFWWARDCAACSPSTGGRTCRPRRHPPNEPSSCTPPATKNPSTAGSERISPITSRMCEERRSR